MAIAIPSGSVVKALGGLKGVAGVDWSKARAPGGCCVPGPTLTRADARAPCSRLFAP